jgi:hypothetical protein
MCPVKPPARRVRRAGVLERATREACPARFGGVPRRACDRWAGASDSPQTAPRARSASSATASIPAGHVSPRITPCAASFRSSSVYSPTTIPLSRSPVAAIGLY